MESLPFAILPTLLEKGASFYEGSDVANLQCEEDRPTKLELLKVRDPWG